MDKQRSNTARPAGGHREPHCTFCDLIHGAAEVSICHEDSDAIAFMDIQPVNNGHILVVPRQHYESLLDVPQELGLHLFRVTMRLANAVRHVTGCEDLNIVVNSGKAAGQDEPHYHVHIIPRREGDGFDIQLPFNGSAMPDRTVLDAYAARIIAALRDPMRVSSHGNGGGSEREAMNGSTATRSEPSSFSASEGSGASDEPRAPGASRASEASNADTPADTPTERAVALPTFDESGNRRPQNPPSQSRSRRGRAVRAVEGPHGELQYEPADGADTNT